MKTLELNTYDVQPLSQAEMTEIDGGWVFFGTSGWSFGTGFKIGLGVGLAAGAGYAVMA